MMDYSQSSSDKRVASLTRSSLMIIQNARIKNNVAENLLKRRLETFDRMESISVFNIDHERLDLCDFLRNLRKCESDDLPENTQLMPRINGDFDGYGGDHHGAMTMPALSRAGMSGRSRGRSPYTTITQKSSRTTPGNKRSNQRSHHHHHRGAKGPHYNQRSQHKPKRAFQQQQQQQQQALQLTQQTDKTPPKKVQFSPVKRPTTEAQKGAAAMVSYTPIRLGDYKQKTIAFPMAIIMPSTEKDGGSEGSLSIESADFEREDESADSGQNGSAGRLQPAVALLSPRLGERGGKAANSGIESVDAMRSFLDRKSEHIKKMRAVRKKPLPERIRDFCEDIAKLSVSNTMHRGKPFLPPVKLYYQ